MKKNLLSVLSIAFLAFGFTSQAQIRYYEEVFTDAEIVKAAENQVYGINVDFLKNQQLYSSAYIQANIAQIQTEHAEIRDSILSGVLNGRAPNVPLTYYQPFSSDPSSIIKLITPLANDPANGVFNPFQMNMMDIYMPVPASQGGSDTETARPVMIYVHTGNFLPKGVNGGVSGTKDDKVAVELCQQWAKRGYVAVAPNYRLGWNPTAALQSDRTRTLLNGVFRAITDIKQVVRTLKSQAAQLGIDPNNIILYGQGSGGYVTLAYNYLDKYAETTLPKFDPDATGITIVDTTLVGNIDGLGGLLNFYQYQSVPGTSAEVAFTANAGGAMGDRSWVEGGEAPTVTFHAIRDPFAPFDAGTVIVPTTNQDVVDADGPNIFMPLINSFGNNSAFENINEFEDPYTTAARAQYGQTYTQDIPIIIGGTSVTISNEAEGLYAFVTPAGESSPWEWWDEAEFNAYHGYLTQLGFAPPTLAPAADILANAALSNPNDDAISKLYLDTIQGYLNRRIMVALQIGDWQTVSTKELVSPKSFFKVYPNPTNGLVNFFTNDDNSAIAEVAIYDLSGRRVFIENNIDTPLLQVDLGSLNQGLYVADITLANGETLSRKFSLR